ncbi:MAG: COQ9 family protein, partial [Sphingopyxis sp.]
MAVLLPADPTLDEIRAALAPLIAQNAAFDGFGEAALRDA